MQLAKDCFNLWGTMQWSFNKAGLHHHIVCLQPRKFTAYLVAVRFSKLYFWKKGTYEGLNDDLNGMWNDGLKKNYTFITTWFQIVKSFWFSREKSLISLIIFIIIRPRSHAYTHYDFIKTHLDLYFWLWFRYDMILFNSILIWYNFNIFSTIISLVL